MSCAHRLAGRPSSWKHLAVWSVLVCCATALQAAERFGDMIGLQVKFAQGQSQAWLPMLDELRVKWVREHVSWSTIEPVPGVYRNFQGDFSERLAYYREHDIGVVMVLGLSNRQAYPPTKAQPLAALDPVAFAMHAVHMARLLRDAKVRFVLEVWNEPHGQASELLPALGGQWNGRPPSPWLDHYLRIVRETVERVKQDDPQTRVISDDDMWVLHYWFLEGGLPRAIDGFGIHPYTIDVPERTAVGPDTDWVQPFAVVDSDRSFYSAVHRLKQQGRQKLQKIPEIWITEWGWAIGQKTPDGPLTEEQVAAYLPRAFINAAAAGVRAMCWFSAQDTVDGPMGLLTNEGRPRAAFYSFKFMARELADLRHDGDLTPVRSRVSGLQVHYFKGARGGTLVLWNVDGEELAVRLDGSVRVTSVADVSGDEILPRRADRHASLLAVGRAPVYVRVAEKPVGTQWLRARTAAPEGS